MDWDIGNFGSIVERDGTYDVLVAGGGSGIGKACAELLGALGATVVIADRSLEAAQAVAGEIAGRGGKASAAEMDITEPQSIRAALDQCSPDRAFHAMVNAAGITGATNVKGHLVDISDFDGVCGVNLRGALLLSQAVLPSMLACDYGRIVHIASIAGKEGNPGMAAYSASKAGLIGLVKSLAKDFAQTGVTINAIAPAVVRTPLVEALPAETVEYMTSKIPMGRCGGLDEIGRAIAWIISPACSFTTGFTFDLSGGRATY